MAIKRPLILDTGLARQLATGDTLDPATVDVPLYIQSTAPSVAVGKRYLWIKTGLPGGNFAFLFDDGT